MANLVALGIDISDFTEEKKARLQEFITLFDTLSKYDGAKFSPISGEGLASLNASLKETTDLIAQLNTGLTSLQTKQASYASNTVAGNTQILESILAAIEAQRTQTAAIEAERIAMSNLARQAQAKSAATRQAARDAADADRTKMLAIKAEAEAVKALSNDYNILKQSIKDKEQKYANLYLNAPGGKNDPSTKAALEDLKNTKSIVNDIDKNLGKAGNSAGLFGGALGKGFGYIRQIAYILPGIGIAGIFNLAFEAIAKAAGKLGIFNEDLIEQAKYETSVNRTIIEQIDLYKKLEEQQRALAQLDRGSITQNQNVIQQNTTFGADQSITLKDELQVANQRFNEAKLRLTEPSIEAMKNDQVERNKELEDLIAKVGDLERRVSDYSGYNKITGKNKEQVQADLDLTKSQLDRLQKEYEQRKDIIKEFYDAQQNLALRDEQLKKFNADEERNIFIKNNLEKVQTSIATNESIVRNEKSTQQQKLDATEKVFELQKKTIELNKQNILLNRSSTPAERSNAEVKAKEEGKRAEIKYNDDIDKINSEYFQRRLKAGIDISKNELEVDAIKNERLFNDDRQSFEDRLNAYKNFVTDKAKIFDKDYEQQVQKPGLAPYEINALGSDRDKNKTDLIADSSKKIYDIVTSYGQQRLKAVKDTNDLIENNYKQSYAQELKDLTKSFQDKEISFEEYTAKYKRMRLSFAASEGKNTIFEDIQSIQNLKNSLNSDINPKIDDAQAGLDAANSTGEQKRIDNAKSILDGLLKVRDDYNKEIAKKEDELGRDLEKQAEAQYQKEIQGYKLLADTKKAIQEELFNFTKTLVDASFEYQAYKIQRLTELQDEQYQNEIDAIERSTLTAKDKAALDIQLSQEKKEYDKQQEVAQREIKRNQAKADRDLSVAKIIWNTAEAETKTYAEYGGTPLGLALSEAVAILGAIQIATVLATPIPAFALGGTLEKGGIARAGEAGLELVKEPGRNPYLLNKDTVSYFPGGTEFVPMYAVPSLPEKQKVADESWKQMMYLGKKMDKLVPKKNTTIINIDGEFYSYKKKILGR